MFGINCQIYSVILSNSLNSFKNNLDKIDYCADNYVS